MVNHFDGTVPSVIDTETRPGGPPMHQLSRRQARRAATDRPSGPALLGLLAAALMLAPVLVGLTARAAATPPITAMPAPVATAPGEAHGPRFTYGADGRGDPNTADCTSVVEPGSSIDAAITAAPAYGVVCVRPGDYTGQLVELNRTGVTVRSVGTARIMGAIVTGDHATLDGFTIVGGTYAHPQEGVMFGGEGQRIVNNLIEGQKLIYGIRCVHEECNHALVYRNTVHSIQNYGMFIDDGVGSLIRQNNIYDLYTPLADSPYADDVDAIRFWGRQTFRDNYIHDINQFKSKKYEGDPPHTDCFQTYNNGADSSGTVIEGNYCVRIGRQCLIAQNDTADHYAISDITFADNVCETYDSQSINLGSMRGVKVINNLILSGYQIQVVSFEQQGLDQSPPVPGPPNTDNTIENNLLIKAKTGARFYEYIGASTDEHIAHNLNRTDTSIFPLDAAFQDSRGAYPSANPDDFTFFRQYEARWPVVDQGQDGVNPCPRDIDGSPRELGASIDLGPYELG
jgi:hypothetical protein